MRIQSSQEKNRGCGVLPGNIKIKAFMCLDREQAVKGISVSRRGCRAVGRGSGSVHKTHCTPSDELYTYSHYRFESDMSPVKVAPRCVRLLLLSHTELLLSALFRFGLFYWRQLGEGGSPHVTSHGDAFRKASAEKERFVPIAFPSPPGKQIQVQERW